MAVVRCLLKEVAFFSDIYRGRGHDLLTDRIDRWVGNLSKKLLKVVKQRLMFL